MKRQKELRDILDNIMAWCAEADMLKRDPVPAEKQHSACEMVGRLSKIELHNDWNGVLGWAIRQVCQLQVPEKSAQIIPKQVRVNRGGTPPPYRDERMVGALLNVIALCTMWVREIESRPDPPDNSVLGRIRAAAEEHVKIRK